MAIIIATFTIMEVMEVARKIFLMIIISNLMLLCANSINFAWVTKLIQHNNLHNVMRICISVDLSSVLHCHIGHTMSKFNVFKSIIII